MTRGTFVQGAFGMYLSDALVGHPYGQKVYATKGTPGWMYPLRATPELLTSGGLAHRTQLVHSSDVSFVTLALELRAGSVVVESGTGSGSLTNALARIVGNTGASGTSSSDGRDAHTCFFCKAMCSRSNSTRSARSTHERRSRPLAMHPASRVRGPVVAGARRSLLFFFAVTTRDAYADGFLVDGALGAGGADAVFLDLPQPWLALGHANTVLRGGGMLVNYSPCFEQGIVCSYRCTRSDTARCVAVEQACALLGQLGFEDVNTVEVRQRPWEMNAVPESAWNVPLEARNAKAPPVRVDLLQMAECSQFRPETTSLACGHAQRRGPAGQARRQRSRPHGLPDARPQATAVARTPVKSSTFSQREGPLR